MERAQAGLEHATELFRALANPMRIAIVLALAAGPRAVGELVTELQVAQPRISEHLATLRAANLVVGEREGRHVRYRLADEHVAHIVEDAVLHANEPEPAAR
jgi:ArsR family transcriptional regulator, zinc-responsive transcriptional repressor